MVTFSLYLYRKTLGMLFAFSLASEYDLHMKEFLVPDGISFDPTAVRGK
jgi:hypothetical protein